MLHGQIAVGLMRRAIVSRSSIYEYRVAHSKVRLTPPPDAELRNVVAELDAMAEFELAGNIEVLFAKIMQLDDVGDCAQFMLCCQEAVGMMEGVVAAQQALGNAKGEATAWQRLGEMQVLSGTPHAALSSFCYALQCQVSFRALDTQICQLDPDQNWKSKRRSACGA